jgi:predicted O-methyltransferase YrrM
VTLREFTPGWLRLAYRHVRLPWHARRLMRAARDAATPAEWFDLVGRFPAFLSIQKPSEIVGLLELLHRTPPETVCEIGSALGGTSFLLARAASPRALVVLIDQAFDGARTGALRLFAGPDQRVVCIVGSSTDPVVRRGLERALGGRPLDFLLIDGDHSYEGVAADFALYSPLVRAGGLIAFHDILPDYGARHGVATPNWSGGVPRLWGELRVKYAGAPREFIADPDQDGYGIGVLTWPG